MKEIKLENITLYLFAESDGVRVKSDSENIVLSNQNVDTVSKLIENNFNEVSNYYKSMIGQEKEKFDFKDIYLFTITIVLHYLYMYNSWRTMYKKQENKDLRFNENDFSNPSTHDIIFNYLKKKYPIDWEVKSAILLGKELSAFKIYYKTREEFYNK